ncbi:MAG: M42 family metallopeptidase [Firmicutes bacterium]|jgi:putative aminopeptidase FrvX|nr:M42 family metallopeptidase [Bacillota bacterium]
MEQKYVDYMLDVLERLLEIPSPSGYTGRITEFLLKELRGMGYEPNTLRKGGVTVDLGGEGSPVMFFGHVDTLGGAVATIKSSGALMLSNIGGLNPNNTETENVIVITRDGQEYEGTLQVANASTHVNPNVNNPRNFRDNVEVLLDEFVTSAADTEALGIQHGDFICLEPRFRITSKGYIKSRFLDDKASSAVLLTFAKYLAEEKVTPKRNTWLSFTMFEEIGHGGATGIPDIIEDVIAVDMGCVGQGLKCTERMVSICPKDSGGIYHYDLTNELIAAAKKAGADYALDVYPMYGSDVEVTLRAGFDVRHGLIGPGVYASHGYERTHIDGLKNTYKVIHSYLIDD